jgi:hypothetical protein
MALEQHDQSAAGDREHDQDRDDPARHQAQP